MSNGPTRVASWFDAPLRAQAVELAATFVAVFALAVESLDDDVRPLTIGVLVGAWASLAFRRVAPLVVLVLTVAARLYLIAETGRGFALLPVVGIALYTVARHGDRRRGLITAGTAAAVMSVIAAALGDDAFLSELFEEGAQAFLPIAVGDAFRTREDRVADMIDAEAEARVQAERLRIARDLHDVVAHGLSTIAIQSGVAARLLDEDQAQAREALDAINATGRASLDDLRSMVGALRSSDVAIVLPTPADPNDIADVLATAGDAGVDVIYERTGAFPDDAGDAVVVAMHRIVQEALMNVARHAGAVRARLTIVHSDDAVAVVVVNEPPIGPPLAVESTGVGIVGMRERAESVGGSLTAEPVESGGFTVAASLPYRRRES